MIRTHSFTHAHPSHERHILFARTRAPPCHALACTASGQRPMTPSYDMATREAKARALDGGSPAARLPSRPTSHSGDLGALQPSPALFTDLQDSEYKTLQQKLLQQQQQQQQQHASFAPVTPAKQQSHPFGRTDAGAYSATESPPGNLSTGSSGVCGIFVICV